jgi:hypothetical protein
MNGGRKRRREYRSLNTQDKWEMSGNISTPVGWKKVSQSFDSIVHGAKQKQ